MNVYYETTSTTEQKRGVRKGAKQAFATLAVLVSLLPAAACSGGNKPVAAAAASGSPSARPLPTPSPEFWQTPWPTRANLHPRATVFLKGIELLPSDLRQETIILRICALRERDASAIVRTTPLPHADEIRSLEWGYDQHYARVNGLPGPEAGGEKWAIREEREQCPRVVPRTPD